MKNMLKVTKYFLIIFAITVACTEEKKACATGEDQVQQPINPNGDSELALLMRAMFEEAQLIKQQIKNGEPITVKLDHEKILTAHATEPEKAASDTYKAFAELYLQNIKSLQSAEPQQVVNIYDNVVQSCMSCHQSLCPGPIVKIKKLQ
jgi:hypothetical protein